MDDTTETTKSTATPAPSLPQTAITPAPAAVVADAEPMYVMLDQFGAKLSKQSGRNVELVTAFLVGEKRAGNTKDTEANYRARYTEFLTKPV